MKGLNLKGNCVADICWHTGILARLREQAQAKLMATLMAVTSNLLWAVILSSLFQAAKINATAFPKTLW